MSSSYTVPSWAALLLIAGMGFGEPLNGAPSPARTDLDSLTDQQLRYYISGELDDIYSNAGGTTKLLPVCAVYEELMDAVSDDGDDDDSDSIDDFIDESDLDAEMEEDGTSIADAVEAALGARCGGGDADAGSHGPRVNDDPTGGSEPPPITRPKAVNVVTNKLVIIIRHKVG